MGTLLVFNSISVDGYFTDAGNDMSFAHSAVPDAEWDAFVSGNAGGGGVLLFGRKTYEMMASFWPTPLAMERMPAVAEGMNRHEKVVFSRTMDEAKWINTRLVRDDMIGEIRRMKAMQQDMVILGSGSVVSQVAQHGLIDSCQFVVIPVALGKGRTMFEGMQERLPLVLQSSRAFRNGNVVLTYAVRT